MQGVSLSGTDIAVLAALADHADGDGVAWPAQELLARKTHFTRRTVNKVMGKAIKAGILEVQHRANERGIETVARYRLKLPGPEPDRPSPPAEKGVHSVEPPGEKTAQQAEKAAQAAGENVLLTEPSVLQPSVQQPPPPREAAGCGDHLGLHPPVVEDAMSKVGPKQRRRLESILPKAISRHGTHKVSAYIEQVLREHRAGGITAIVDCLEERLGAGRLHRPPKATLRPPYSSNGRVIEGSCRCSQCLQTLAELRAVSAAEAQARERQAACATQPEPLEQPPAQQGEAPSAPRPALTERKSARGLWATCDRQNAATLAAVIVAARGDGEDGIARAANAQLLRERERDEEGESRPKLFQKSRRSSAQTQSPEDEAARREHLREQCQQLRAEAQAEDGSHAAQT